MIPDDSPYPRRVKLAFLSGMAGAAVIVGLLWLAEAVLSDDAMPVDMTAHVCVGQCLMGIGKAFEF